ncbi:hypothetical protein GEMRC1_010680 [Eukaryota sp. GEM-RC1]
MTTCPHTSDVASPSSSDLDRILRDVKCSQCDESECWLCCHCLSVNCSRYKNKHSLQHYESSNHCIAISLSDLSAYCYLCDSYIIDNNTSSIISTIHTLKFDFAPPPALFTAQPLSEADGTLQSLISNLSLDVHTQSPLDKAVDAINKASNIVLLTGAGISVSCGIPDFRTEAIGLYAQIKSRFPDLPSPMSMFDLQFFKSNLVPFYELVCQLIPDEVSPSVTHYFIAFLDYIDKLSVCVTQNIDGLEKLCKLPNHRLINAHGDFERVFCLSCATEYPKSSLQAAVRHCEPLYCSKRGCGGLLKPGVTFFGEALPPSFSDAMTHVSQSDLMIVMGTSLQVFPVAALPQFTSDDVTRIVINRDKPDDSLRFDFNHRDLFLEGDLDLIVIDLIDRLGLTDEFQEFMKERRYHGPLFDETELISDFDGEDLMFIADCTAPFTAKDAVVGVCHIQN